MMKKIVFIALTSCLVLLLATGIAAAAPGGNGKGNSTGGAKSSTASPQQKGNASLNSSQITVENSDLTVNVKSPNKNTLKNQAKLSNQVRQTIKEKLEARMQDKSTTKAFKDVEKHWAAAAIEKMAALGLFSGYPDGTFKPDQSINQAEAITMVMNLAATTEETAATTDGTTTDDSSITTDDPADPTDDTNVEDTTETDEALEDVPAWAKDSASKAYQKGFLNMNRFHSQVQASRAQTAVWIAKALELEPVDTTAMPFVDGVAISAEDAGYIMALYQEGILQGTPDGKFNPDSAITRAEIATIMQKILDEQPDDGTSTTDEENTADTTTDTTNTTDTDTANGNTDTTDSSSTAGTQTSTSQDNTSTPETQPTAEEPAQ